MTDLVQIETLRTESLFGTPCRVEDELKKISANHVKAGLGAAVQSDDNLITKQKNFSGSETLEAAVTALGE